jgi:hypothetical protein
MLLSALSLPLLLLLQAFLSDTPFRYLYLGQFPTLPAALNARATAQQVLYGQAGRSNTPPAKTNKSMHSAAAAAAANDAGAEVQPASEADLRAMASKLTAGKQGDVVKGVMKHHGTLGLLDEI